MKLAFAADVSEGFVRNASVEFVSVCHGAFAVTVVTLIVFYMDFILHNLDRDVSFANNHGCIVMFSGTIRPRRIAGILHPMFANDGMDSLTLNASRGAVEISAGCGVSSGSPGMSGRIRSVLCDTLSSTKVIARNSTSSFGGPSLETNNSVVDDAGIKPSMTGSVACKTVIDIVVTLVTVFVCVLLHFHGITFSVNSAIMLIFSAVLILKFCSLL